MTTIQTCSSCKQEKPVMEFPINTKARSGYSSHCKACKKQRYGGQFQSYYAENKSRLNANTKAWREKKRAENPIDFWVHNNLVAVKGRAKRNGLDFDLDVDFLRSIVTTHCPIFGVELIYGLKKDVDFTDRGKGASLDRKDSARGYTKDNVWIISYRANSIKQDATIAELEQVVEGLRRWMT